VITPRAVLLGGLGATGGVVRSGSSRPASACAAGRWVATACSISPSGWGPAGSRSPSPRAGDLELQLTECRRRVRRRRGLAPPRHLAAPRASARDRPEDDAHPSSSG